MWSDFSDKQTLVYKLKEKKRIGKKRRRVWYGTNRAGLLSSWNPLSRNRFPYKDKRMLTRHLGSARVARWGWGQFVRTNPTTGCACSPSLIGCEAVGVARPRSCFKRPPAPSSWGPPYSHYPSSAIIKQLRIQTHSCLFMSGVLDTEQINCFIKYNKIYIHEKKTSLWIKTNKYLA